MLTKINPYSFTTQYNSNSSRCCAASFKAKPNPEIAKPIKELLSRLKQMDFNQNDWQIPFRTGNELIDDTFKSLVLTTNRVKEGVNSGMITLNISYAAKEDTGQIPIFSSKSIKEIQAVVDNEDNFCKNLIVTLRRLLGKIDEEPHAITIY